MATESKLNPFVSHSRLTENKFLKTLELLLEGESAALISDKVDIDRNTANAYAHALRVRIAKYCEERYRPLSFSKMPVATSFKNTKNDPRFREWQVVEKRKRTNKTGKKVLNKDKPILIRALKRKPSHFAIKVLEDGKVWTALIPKWDDFNYLYRAEKYLSRSGTWKQWLAFDAIAGYGSEKPLRILKQDNSPEVKGFWYDFISTLKKRRGTNDRNFYYHLKEAEFRHNTQNENPTAILAAELLKTPLSLDLSKP
ncbi:MAG: hypothetical protein WBK28_00275 [Minisyncoccia bacterium]